MSYNPIGNDGLNVISESIEKDIFENLKKLNLIQTKIDSEGVYKLFFTLQHYKKLEHLNLSKNNLQSKKFSEIKHFLFLSNLKELRLSNCKIGNDGGIIK